MAYMSQDHKAKLAPTIMAICKKYGVKASLGVRNHSSLVLKIKSSGIDFFGSYNRVAREQYGNREGWVDAKNCLDVNPYHYQRHFDGKALAFLSEVIPAMYGTDYFDHSDIQTDYFHCSHYVDVCIGVWNKPYILA